MIENLTEKSYKITILTNGSESDEAEIRRIEERPVFPGAEQEGSAENIANHQENAKPDRDRLYRLSLLIIIDVILVIRVNIVQVHLSV